MTFKNLFISGTMGILLASSLVACSTQTKSTVADAGTEVATVASGMSGPSDSEIAHVLTTVNQTEIEVAELAKSKAKNRQVTEFASQMIKEHTAANKRTAELAQKLNLEPENNAISLSIKTGASSIVSSLKDLNGKEFEKAYIDQQIAQHQTVLETIDQNLIPNADDPQMKDLLNQARPKIAAHIEHAKKIQQSLTK